MVVQASYTRKEAEHVETKYVRHSVDKRVPAESQCLERERRTMRRVLWLTCLDSTMDLEDSCTMTGPWSQSVCIMECFTYR